MLDDDAVKALVERARRDVDDGVVPSCQLAVGLGGQVVVDETLGQAGDDTRYVMFSCTKALVAGAVWHLISEGRLDVSKPVVEWIPEFGTNGKQVVTVEQLLTHTSGFPTAPLGPPQWAERDERLRRFAQWRLNWEPGSRYEYHPTSAHWVLAEVIARVTGHDHRTVINGMLDRLGLPRLRLGVPVDDQSYPAVIVPTGEPATPEEIGAVLGMDSLPVGEVTDEALLAFNDPAARAVGVPGAGGVGTAADLARYYQHLLCGCPDLWDPAVLADGTGRIRVTMPDPLLGHPANRSLGLVVAGDDGKSAYRGMGHTVSARAFGHNGAGGQVAWADPATGLSFTYLTNGLDANLLRQSRRGNALSSRAAVCGPAPV